MLHTSRRFLPRLDAIRPTQFGRPPHRGPRSRGRRPSMWSRSCACSAAKRSNCARARRREVLCETQVPVEVRAVGEDSAAERAVAEVDGAPMLGAVVARPVQDQVAVHHAVASLEPHLHAVQQGHPWVRGQLPVLFRRVRAPVAAGHHPQHIIVVEGGCSTGRSRGRWPACPLAGPATAPGDGRRRPGARDRGRGRSPGWT